MCKTIQYSGIVYCSDYKCLRKVCEKHPSQVPNGMKQFAWYTPNDDCKERIRMEGDEDLEKWPSSDRINIIGQNGNDGSVYESCVYKNLEKEDE